MSYEEVTLSPSSTTVENCKNYAQFLVDNIPYLELFAVNADSSSQYDCVIRSNAGSRDKLAIRIYYNNYAYCTYGYIANDTYVALSSATSLTLSKGRIMYKFNDDIFAIRETPSPSSTVPYANMQFFFVQSHFLTDEAFLIFRFSGSHVIVTGQEGETPAAHTLSCSYLDYGYSGYISSGNTVYLFPYKWTDNTSKYGGNLGVLTLKSSMMFKATLSNTDFFFGISYQLMYIGNKRFFALLESRPSNYVNVFLIPV